jgi:prophage regulatory protein
MHYYNSLPETGYLRIKQIIGDKKAKPPLPPIIPVGRSTWWEGVKDGRFPKPVKISERTTAWKVEDIKSLIESYSKTTKD